ncbi:MAG: DUF4469 domain-containing protein [Tannerellaceae bacterium]|jgi:hypothetical protein|nr:DUF4469 domain-containing protein [Tannerellaceae bacterium]
METIIKLRYVIHRIAVWFVENTLPSRKKRYVAWLHTLPYLGVGEVAAKAPLYGEDVDREDMLRYVNQYLNLCAYLVADGYGIENSLFRTRIRVPGEYDSYDTSLPEDIYPEAGIRVSQAFRRYIRDHVKVDIKGVDETNGHIFTVTDDATGKENEVITIGKPVHIKGIGLKILHDDIQTHIDKVGLWFIPNGGMRIDYKSTFVIINETHTIAAIVPEDLVPDTDYYIELVTQSSVRGIGLLLREVRRMRTDHIFMAKS